MSYSPEWRRSFERSQLDQADLHCVWPDDAEYDSARVVFNRMHDKRPALIVRARTPSAVASILEFAQSKNIVITIRGGGHHIGGFSVADNAIMLDYSDQREVHFDVSTKQVRVSPGARLADLDAVLVPHGVVVPTGTVSETGIAGLTLGGGIGWLIGKHGLTCDHLVGVDIVFADGSNKYVHAGSDPDLLWALRGGGGNFGVVTSFHFRPVDLGHILAGTLNCGPLHITEKFEALCYWLANKCPSELTAAPTIRNSGCGPTLTVDYCQLGQPTSAFDELTKIARPLPGSRHTNDYIAFQKYFDAYFHIPRRGYWKSHYQSNINSATTQMLVEAISNAPSGCEATIIVEHLHGAFAQRDPLQSAFPIVENKLGVLVSARWQLPADDFCNTNWVRSCFQSCVFARGTNYSNYASPGDFSINQFSERAAERLRSVKKRVDPDNVFRNNHNIK